MGQCLNKRFRFSVSPWGTKGIGSIQTMIELANRSSIFDERWQQVVGHLRTDSSLIVQNWKCLRDGFRAQRRIYFYFFKGWCHCEIVRWANYFLLLYVLKGNWQKNISPPLGVIRWVIRFSTKISPTLWVFYKHQSFLRKPFSLRLISLAEKWKECRCPVRWDWHVEIVRPRIWKSMNFFNQRKIII